MVQRESGTNTSVSHNVTPEISARCRTQNGAAVELFDHTSGKSRVQDGADFESFDLIFMRNCAQNGIAEMSWHGTCTNAVVSVCDIYCHFVSCEVIKTVRCRLNGGILMETYGTKPIQAENLSCQYNILDLHERFTGTSHN